MALVGWVVAWLVGWLVGWLAQDENISGELMVPTVRPVRRLGCWVTQV